MKKGLAISASAFLMLTLAIGVAEAATVSQKTKGKILLQVESKGEAWYVDPTTGERNSLGKPADALNVMKKVGIGITNANLQKIQLADVNLSGETDTDADGLSDALETALSTDKENTDSDSDGTDDKTEALNGYNPNSSSSVSLLDAAFAKKQAGKILLQVESKGEAWYINPDNNKRYFLGRPADAFNVMRSLGLGISNSDLNKITESGHKASVSSSSSSSATASSTKKIEKKDPGKGSGNKATSTPPLKGGATSTPPLMGNGERPDNGLMATVTAIGDSSLTVTASERGGEAASSSSEIYTVALDSSTVYMQDRATSTISAVAVGSRVMISGTIDKTAKTVVATKVDVMTKDPAMEERPTN